jgi:Sec-independent protein secretion pathway component TatC
VLCLQTPESEEFVMWSPGVGINEIVLTLLIALPFLLLGARGRRWLLGVLPCLVIAAIVTPSDIFSMLIVALPLLLAFVGGVALSPYIHASMNENASSK